MNSLSCCPNSIRIGVVQSEMGHLRLVPLDGHGSNFQPIFVENQLQTGVPYLIHEVRVPILIGGVC